jgi:hypothetical protein
MHLFLENIRCVRYEKQIAMNDSIDGLFEKKPQKSNGNFHFCTEPTRGKSPTKLLRNFEVSEV